MSAGPFTIVLLLAVVGAIALALIATLVVRLAHRRIRQTAARSTPGAGPRNPRPGGATHQPEEEPQ